MNINKTPDPIPEIIDCDILHHPVIMVNGSSDLPIGIGLADENNVLIGFVPMNLVTAAEFGKMFIEKFNEQLVRVRGDT